MNNYSELVKFLKSKDFETFVMNEYSDQIEKLDSKLKKDNIYISYIKAFIIDMYQSLNDEDKGKYVRFVKKYGLTDNEADYIFFNLNSSTANINDHIDEESKEFFDELKSYLDKPIAKMLAKYRNEIFKILSEEMGVFTIEQIKDGNYYIPEKDSEGKMGEYCLDDSEIEAIEKAHESSLLVNICHSLYDYVKYVPKPSILGNGMVVNKYITCDNDKADIEGLGNLTFNTLKDGPKLETDIVFEDGIIMRYHKGNISKEPYTIDELLSYIYADIAKILEELGFNESNVNSMGMNELNSVIWEACVEIVSQSDFFSQRYSKKMIETSKEYIRSLRKIVKRENL